MDHRRALGVIVLVLLGSNVLVNAVLTPAAYVPWNLAVTVVLLAVVRRAGTTWSDLGLDRRSVSPGLRWGAVGAGLVLLAYAVALVLPPTRELFQDARASDREVADLLYHALVQIPLGTVVLEEVAFRGVLPAALGWRPAESWRWRPVVIASALFGLWHVLPSIDVAGANQGVSDALDGSRPLTALLAVAGTSVAGVVLCWWRQRARGGLLAPVMIHLATNVAGYAVAWVATG